MNKRAGVLLAISSLPHEQAVGSLGLEAEKFLNWLREHGVRYWQILPITPLGLGDCPYDSSSSFAIDPIFIDRRYFVELGLELPQVFKAGTRGGIDYARARTETQALLRAASHVVLANPTLALARELNEFVSEEKSWLDDWVLYRQLSVVYKTGDFSQWPVEVRRRNPEALHQLRELYACDLMSASLGQLLAQKSLLHLKSAAEKNGIRLIGDLPIYVSYESADVWAHQEIFQLDANGKRELVSGVPPDAMCADGQTWNHPLYRWELEEKGVFPYWRQRMARSLRFFHQLRLDHFIGFCRYYAIPFGAHASRGTWQPGPGRKFFASLAKDFGKTLPFIAEDLGAVAEDVFALRREFAIPGMSVMVFDLDGDALHAPESVDAKMVYYTSTHDTDTLVATAQSRVVAHDDQNHRELLKRAAQSPAELVILPWQDILGLGSEARMNIPGLSGEQWRYRAGAQDLKPMPWLQDMLSASGRGRR